MRSTSRAVRLEETNVLPGRFLVHDTDETQPEIGTDLRESNTHVARARLDNRGLRRDRTTSHRASDDVDGWSISMLPPGLKPSSLAKRLKGASFNTLSRRMSGVLPMVDKMP